MGDLIVNNNKKKKRLSISLSLFSGNDHTLKSFQPNRVVGLGIVAALGESGPARDRFQPNRVVMARSNPIPIVFNTTYCKKGGGSNLKKGGDDDNDDDLGEEYTCVISHIGDNLIKKTEYFDHHHHHGGGVLANEIQTTITTTLPFGGGSDEVAAVEKAASFQGAEFLKCCYLCKKHLHGLDIYIYRGEKAFCSAECRCKQMGMDELQVKTKCKSKTTMMMMPTKMMNNNNHKPMSSFDFSSSATNPCSSPVQLLFAAA